MQRSPLWVSGSAIAPTQLVLSPYMCGSHGFAFRQHMLLAAAALQTLSYLKRGWLIIMASTWKLEHCGLARDCSASPVQSCFSAIVSFACSATSLLCSTMEQQAVDSTAMQLASQVSADELLVACAWHGLPSGLLVGWSPRYHHSCDELKAHL
ncbi:hypothetical protein COO60DRAFT_847436 [Scenedesmus sp. NREL 46B-D3]|nr:hypothetical protein COO60DRAFT_847436 [Scenedesmus sp. NREL 46B-D3]